MDTTTEIPLYAYANSAFDKANDLKSLETEIYTIGTFNNMSNPPEEVKGAALLFQNTLRDIASDSLHYYPVYDTSNLSFAFGNIIGEISSPECKEGYFYYSSGDDKDYSAKYYYRDDYFSTSAQEYNKSLSTMSLCLAMSAFGTNEPNLSSGGYLSENDLYSDNYKNAQDLLEKLNFQAIEHNEYFELVPTLDSIGVIAGLRKIEIDSKKYTLIAVAVRGANYEAEWGANLLLGESGNHLGFENAKNKVLDFLVKYISAKSDLIEGDIKLWMTGFSRAAAVTNLLAGEITTNKCIGDNTINPDNIYVYCFECPRGLKKDTGVVLSNIHNVVNPNDIVPLVAMENWGFYRYGVDENVIPDVRRTSRYIEASSKMMNKYIDLNTDAVYESSINYGVILSAYDLCKTYIKEWCEWKYLLIDNSSLYTSYDVFEKEVIDSFENSTKKYINDEYAFINIDFTETFLPNLDSVSFYDISRAKKYYSSYVDATVNNVRISKLDLFKYKNYLSKLTGYGLYQSSTLLNDEANVSLKSLNDTVVRNLSSIIGSRKDYVSNIQSGLVLMLSKIKGRIKYKNSIIPAFVEATKKTCNSINPKVKILSDFMSDSIYESCFKLALDFENDKELIDDEIDDIEKSIKNLLSAIYVYLSSSEGKNNILNLVNNIDLLGYAHYPELCLAWLQSLDPNYSEEIVIDKFPTNKRILCINCPVDVYAYNSDDRLVASIINDTPQIIENSLIDSLYSSDGEKILYLPEDENYKVILKATDNGKMDISIRKMDLNGNYTYVSDYNDISINKGDIFDISLPKEFITEENGECYEYNLKNLVVCGNTDYQPQYTYEKDIPEYSITVENDNLNGGICYGGGNYITGSYATVIATEFLDCEFDGWYEGEVLVSRDREYKFKVLGDKIISAHFIGITSFGRNGIFYIKSSSNEGGFIENEKEILVYDGYPVTYKAYAYPGYEFEKWDVLGKCNIEDIYSSETQVIAIDEDVELVAIFRKIDENNTNETYSDNQDNNELDGLLIDFKLEYVWSDGSIGSITITNKSGKDVNGWFLKFDTDSELNNIWNANIISKKDKTYCVSNCDWNYLIRNNESITLGFVSNTSIDDFENFKIFSRKNNNIIKDGYSIEFNKFSEWEGGYVGEIVISNNSSSQITDWTLEFVFNGVLNSVWNGKKTTINDEVIIIEHEQYNNIIYPGEKIRIGINAEVFDDYVPFDFKLYATLC